jgi:hypothetical protein
MDAFEIECRLNFSGNKRAALRYWGRELHDEILARRQRG